MPTRTASTTWRGGLQSGSGTVELTSSGVGSYEVSFPKRAADEAGGATSPEELIAAAHSSCYAMQLSHLVAEAGGTPRTLEVRADVSLGPDPAGGFRLTGIRLTVRGDVEGLDAVGFSAAAEKAKAGCPVSKALTGVDISLDAALAWAAQRRDRGPGIPQRISPPRGMPGAAWTAFTGLSWARLEPRLAVPRSGFSSGARPVF